MWERQNYGDSKKVVLKKSVVASIRGKRGKIGVQRIFKAVKLLCMIL
jgi:hypothetical protein